jgi:hypothetical protein
MLVAIKAWQQLLREGPQKIGDTVFLGKMPVYAGQSLVLADQPRMDVLETLWYDAKVRFSLDAEGRVALVEVFGDAKNDPVELYLDQYVASDNEKLGMLPRRLRLQYGMQTVLMLESESDRIRLASDDSQAADPQETAP